MKNRKISERTRRKARVDVYGSAIHPMKRSEDNLATKWSLVTRMKNTADEKTWSEFAQLYRDLIRGVARKAGLNEEEAKDVVQETMAAVAKNIEGFEATADRGSFRAWLLQMARWRIMDQIRRRLPVSSDRIREDCMEAGVTSRTATVERVPDPREVNLEALCDEEWKQQLLSTALRQLQGVSKAEHYQIFHLLEIERKSIAEVAKMVGRSRGSLYLIRHRMLKELRRGMKQVQKEAEGRFR